MGLSRALRVWSLLLALAVIAGCTGKPAVVEPQPQPPTSEQPPESTPPEPHREPPVHARILAVGDLLMHTPLVYSSALPNDEWDFKPLFAHVQPWIESADLAIANLETTLTGTRYPWAGYPSFNTPPEFARDLKAVGFDALVHANNHSLDYSEYGLIQTIEALERYGIPRTGTNRTEAERDQILVVPVAPTINMAILNYTYGTNGVPLPHPWSVNMLDKERIANDIRRARKLADVDLVAVALHMGDEYAREPNPEQEEYVNLSLQAGADIVLGNHPHVIQKIETRQVKDEFGREARRAVIYSLGNFISNQVGLAKEAGLMLLIDVKKEEGVTTIEQIAFVPTWVHPYQQGDTKRYRVVAVEKALKDFEAKRDPLITQADYQRLKAVWADTTVQAAGTSDIAVWSVDKPAAVTAKP